MLRLRRARRRRDGDAAQAPVEPAVPARPTIGLALGGGAARGLAHIGVLRALMRAGYTPDVIAGTSIGAVVGGLHAAGKLDALADWATSLKRRDVISLVDIAISGGGLMGGSRVARLLEREIGDIRIEDLPIPFAAVATEIGTGHEIWLTRGLLMTALRGSYALPGILPPVRIGGRWLMDGALSNPVPVSVVRALGARLVIAVSLNADALGRATVIQDHGTSPEDEALPLIEPRPRVRAVVNLGRGLGRGLGRALARPLRIRAETAEVTGAIDPRIALARSPGIPTVLAKGFNATQERIARTRLAGDPPNVLIGPRMSRLGLFEFHRAAEAIALGEEATERLLPDIAEAMKAVA
ncbi:patatin-like phospholipase family protein [Phreatobacter sp. AB_2022a]|uniref:patatin-like phospholipase family protein n=1 Tax=Phreatobacter sp. AB_2022a TaxID=3003134 RepID=UPI002286DCFE|nr:patatin-like phospholipase family protein [Phreatobacter sp. AB_2022a]MCZ0736513.1 patatin-like phospholipase family protein [Phreatobacter sp. AB_2022a]